MSSIYFWLIQYLGGQVLLNSISLDGYFEKEDYSACSRRDNVSSQSAETIFLNQKIVQFLIYEQNHLDCPFLSPLGLTDVEFFEFF